MDLDNDSRTAVGTRGKITGEILEVRSDKRKPREEREERERRNRRNRRYPKMSQICPQDVIERILEKVNGPSEIKKVAACHLWHTIIKRAPVGANN